MTTTTKATTATAMKRLLGALVPVLCTVACGQTVGAGGAGAGDGGAFSDAGSLGTRAVVLTEEDFRRS